VFRGASGSTPRKNSSRAASGKAAQPLVVFHLSLALAKRGVEPEAGGPSWRFAATESVIARSSERPEKRALPR